METPLIVALSRQISVRDQMDAIANNIANMSTGAYKSERVMFKDYVARTTAGKDVVFPQNAGIHRVNAQGSIDATGNSLDVALRGDGYLVVQTLTGPRYTRDGRLTLDANGQLVNARGQAILDDQNRPLAIDAGVKVITISKNGSVRADDRQVGQIKVVKFDNPQRLTRQGGGLYATDAEAKRSPETEVLQGHIETSNVEPILEVTRLMTATGFYQLAKKMVEDEHERLTRGIQTLGRMPE